ncbi:MAG: hypothetical protein RJB66_594 [Pseudomonadota bacterium]|jgi:tetratricopeptide (TPR) repeat protein
MGFDTATHYDEDETKLRIWEAEIEKKNYQTVTQEIVAFLKHNPASQHWYAILFTLGRAKEGMEDWQGAIESYREIIQRSTDKQMEFVALASYRIAYCNEVLLENEKALAALSDAYKLKQYLPIEISLAEIPARIASIHSRMNQGHLADSYTTRAEKGLTKLKAIKKGSDPEWVSRTLVRMGSISLSQIDSESFRQSLSTLNRNQKFLLQAIEVNHPAWAPAAQSMLLNTYTNLWQFIENFRLESTYDWETDLVSQSQQKSFFLATYLESLERLKSYRPPEETSVYVKSAPLFEKLSILESKASYLLNSEMLKKPWNLDSTLASEVSQTPAGASTNLKVQTFEADSRPEYIPTQLPKKKVPTR